MNRYCNSRRIFACGALMLLVASTAAQATDLPDSATPQRHVSYADLDLNRHEGIATLYSRINSAAREVCPADVSANSYLARAARECRTDAVARAVRDVGAPALTDYHMTKTSQRILLAQH
jgi:UrcA family protein